jgi:large subunit ribosomal protein L1
MSRLFQNLAASRQFSTSQIALARQHKSKINIPSKKALAAKAKRKSAKAPKHIYHKERMPLTDAVAILRVRPFIWFLVRHLLTKHCRQ